MNETDNFVFGPDGPMPRLGAVRAIDSSSVRVDWIEGARAGRTEAINLLPLIDNLIISKYMSLFGTMKLCSRQFI